MNSKIERDLQELLAAKVISEDTSQNITNYYATKKSSSPNQLFTIFGVLGSLLVGLGIILILAHNWDDFSRMVKTAWAFIPLVIGQALVGYTLLKKKGRAWRESTATFLYFTIGASISLISQIYNIPGEMPDFLLTWIILGAPLVYLLRSHAAALLHIVFATSYACNLGYFNDASPWLYFVLLLWLAPYYYQLLKSEPHGNFTGMMNWAIPISVISVMGGFISGDTNIGFLLYIALLGVIYNFGKLKIFDSGKLRKNGYAIIGSLGTVFTLSIVTFTWFWSDVPSNYQIQDVIITLTLMGLGIGLLLYLFQKKQLKPFNLFQYAFLIFGIIFLSRYYNETLPTVLTNLLVFGLGVFAIRIGNIRNNFGVLNYGLLIITVLIGCRFFDTNIDFVVRGLLFVAIGVGFFVTNYFMYKKQRNLKTKDHE